MILLSVGFDHTNKLSFLEIMINMNHRKSKWTVALYCSILVHTWFDKLIINTDVLVGWVKMHSNHANG